MTWLSDLVLQHSELEAPQSFWYWSGLAAISAVVKDNLWLDKQIYNLYPNIYVMLHADSGLRKGAPISMAKQLVRACNNTRIISGRSSIQGILKEMGTAYSQPGGNVVNKAVAFICSSELSSSIVEDKAATTILTDLYDRSYNEGEWKSLLKMETFNLKDPTVTMLTGTNEAMAEDFFVRKDVQGGYFARTFIIYENSSLIVNSLMFPLTNKPDYVQLSKYLKEIALLKGQFTMSNEVRRYFDEWYKAFRAANARDNTGTLNRFDDSVLKVAMLISLGTNKELEITEEMLTEAIGRCETLVGNVRKTTMAAGKSEWTAQKSLLINELVMRDGHTISKQMLNKKYWMHCSDRDWDDITQQMEIAGYIKVESQGNTIMYRMPDEQVVEWKAYFAGKAKKQ
jgi:hypothetical protein